MTTTSELFAIAEAAIEYEVVRRLMLRFKSDRAACRCELAAPDEPEVGATGTPPCWYAATEPTGDWCEQCRRRHPIHLRYRAAMNALAVARRRFQRAALHAIDPKTIDRRVADLTPANEQVEAVTP